MRSDLFSSLRRACWPPLCLVSLICAGGCSAQDDGRVEVAGAVTWKGQPIKTGFITFHPNNGKAPASGRIENGTYRFDSFPGTCRVMVQAAEVVGFDEGMRQPITKQYIPDKYNQKSEMTVEVTSDGENRFDFTLTE